MASYNGSIDLLALNGAQVFSGIDQKNPKRAFVCIPVDVNEIKIQESRTTGTAPSASPEGQAKQRASLRISIFPLPENYKNAVRRSAQERGDMNANVPTHELQRSFSVDYIKLVIKQFPRLVEEVKNANVERDPDIVNQDPNDENTHLFKSIRNRMNKRLAVLYQPQVAPAQPAYPQTFASAGTPTAYVAPAEGEQFNSEAYNSPDSDLPF